MRFLVTLIRFTGPFDRRFKNAMKVAEAFVIGEIMIGRGGLLDNIFSCFKKNLNRKWGNLVHNCGQVVYPISSTSCEILP